MLQTTVIWNAFRAPFHLQHRFYTDLLIMIFSLQFSWDKSTIFSCLKYCHTNESTKMCSIQFTLLKENETKIFGLQIDLQLVTEARLKSAARPCRKTWGVAEDMQYLYCSSSIISSVTLKVLTAISLEAEPLRQKLVHLARRGSHAVT